MSEKTLQIFELCQKLTELLGDKEAIADLKLLLERHPEMFRDKEEVREIIERVVSEPDLIVKNLTPIGDKDFIAAKRLNNEKMADVGIRDSDGINVIYHTNKKKREEFERLKDKIEKGKMQVVGSPISYTQAQSLDGLVDNNISPANDIIPQKNNQSQALDMNDDSALKALKNEVSNTKESEIENNTSSQDYQTELLKHKRQRR